MDVDKKLMNLTTLLEVLLLSLVPKLGVAFRGFWRNPRLSYHLIGGYKIKELILLSLATL